MAISSPRLRRLDSALAYLHADSDVMSLSALDGFLTGIILCPEAIPAEEWMPLVWSGEGAPPPFEDAREAAWYADLVMGQHDAIVQALARGRYAPFLEEDVPANEIMWEIWVEGFDEGIRLRHEGWTPLLDSDDDEAAMSFSMMIALIDIAHDESDLERDAIDKLTELAPVIIPKCVREIDRWRAAYVAQSPALTAAVPPAKIGRNDPCPCGSGRKYKKCCGADL